EEGPPDGGRGGFGPVLFIGPGLFSAADIDKDGSLTRTEFKQTFAKWFGEWDADKTGSLNEEKVRNGFAAALPPPTFGGPGRGFGGPGERGQGGGFGGRGFGGGQRIEGVKLDPLIAATDQSKPLISKLLA